MRINAIIIAVLPRLVSVAVATSLVDHAKPTEVALHAAAPHPEFLVDTIDGKQEIWGWPRW